jgi:uncharacterized protein YdaU (DUF1376 family)
MKTAPSFQFYPADFVNGTLTMDAAEVGAYIRLLCYQWNQGSCPTEPDDIARITGMPHAKLVRRVLPKFTVSGDSMHNERLERTRAEVEAYRARQADNGKKGGRPPKATLPKEETQKNPPLSSGLTLGNPLESSHTHTQTLTHSQNNPLTPKGAEWLPTPEQLEVASWFGRRQTTRWQDDELKAWRKLTPEIISEGLEVLAGPYKAKAPYVKTKIITLLNSWTGEVDRWRSWTPQKRSNVSTAGMSENDVPWFEDQPEQKTT